MLPSLSLSLQTMLKRLQEVKPQYSVSNCVEHWRKNAELVERLTAYPTASPSLHKVSEIHSVEHTSFMLPTI